MLLYLKFFLRPLISLSAEYALRRLICAPFIHRRVTEKKIIHFAVWRSGSNWVRLLLSDPRLTIKNDIHPFLWKSLTLKPKELKRFLTVKRKILLCMYRPNEWFYQNISMDGSVGFAIVRNPYALLNSWYFSTLETHEKNDKIQYIREKVAFMTDDEKHAFVYEEFKSEFFPVFSEIYRNRDAIKIVKFEDITGKNRYQHTKLLLDYLSLECEPDTLAAIINTYSKNVLAKSRLVKNRKYTFAYDPIYPDKVDTALAQKICGDLEPYLTMFGYNQ